MSKTPFTIAQCKKCPIHAMVVDQCKLELAQHGYFSKKGVLKTTNLFGIGASIRWDYVRTIINEDLGESLQAMSKKFFEGELIYKNKDSKQKTRITYDPKKNPEKCAALGHGKVTHGYALVSIGGGKIASLQIQNKLNIAEGNKRKQIEMEKALASSKSISTSVLTALPLQHTLLKK